MLTERSGRAAQAAETDETAGQFQQALVKVRASFVADAEPFELVQPGESALDYPTHLAQARAVSDAASGNRGLDAPLPEQTAVLVEVVGPVRVEPTGLTAGTPLRPRIEGIASRSGRS